MRLRRLDLTRYGRFTDKTLDFGEHQPGTPDLHLIYGPNEAGKSTTLSAFLDLLFGIETRSRYNFLHPYQTMQIGAALEIQGQPHELIRVKNAELRDNRGQKLGEALLQSALGGLDRAAYRAMFSLDDETLEAGGQSILASRGDLGQLLFSASAGLAELSRTLVDLRVEADGFYKLRAHDGALIRHRQALAQLEQDRKAIDMLATDYVRLIDERNLAATQYEAALSDRTSLERKRDTTRRLLQALPIHATLQSLRTRHTDLGSLPNTPAAWSNTIETLRDEETQLATEAQSLTRDIADRTAALEAIVVDTTALHLSDRLAALSTLRGRHETATLDIPLRQSERAAAQAEIDTILAQIGRPTEADPTRLLLHTARTTALAELARTRSGIEAAVETAQDELADALHVLTEAQRRLQEAGHTRLEAPAAARLHAALTALRDSDHPQRARTAQRDLTGLHAQLSSQIQNLQPWSGTAETLARLPVPPAPTLAAWSGALTRLQADIDATRKERAKREAERIRLTAETNAAHDIANLASDHAAAQIRLAREAAWAAHRRTLDPTTADGFETALRQDDATTAARAAAGQELARLQQTTRQLAIVTADCDHLDQSLAVATAEHQRLNDSIAAELAHMPGLNPATLPPWLVHRSKALETHDSIARRQQDADQAATDAATVRDRLAQAITTAGLPGEPDIEALTQTAQAALDRQAELQRHHDAVETTTSEIRTRERNLQKAATADKRWRTAWAEACAGTWLEAEPPDPKATPALLLALGKLAGGLTKATGLDQRLADMARDQAVFTEAVTVLSTELALPPAPPLDRFATAQARLQSARTAAEAQSTQQAALEKLQATARALRHRQNTHAAQKSEMTNHFGIETLAEVADRLRAIATQKTLAADIAQAEHHLLETLQLSIIAEAETLCATADKPALESEHAELDARHTLEDRRTQEKYAAHRTAIDRIEAVGGDDQAARIEMRRRNLLLNIQDKAQHYLRLRVGITAAEHALRLYRERHRSRMMARASDAFALISRNTYRGLSTRPERDGEVLIAIGADTGAKLAEDLSKGTRFQLYLALRAAGHAEFCDHRTPVPFIADDIMETFDDFRAEEAFRLFAAMARTGQVIYLTHHRHLCTLARQVHPHIRIHDLTETAETIRQIQN